MTPELHLAQRDALVADLKPNLRRLTDDVRRAADMAQTPGRRDALGSLHAALHIGLLDSRSEDVTAEDADSFRREWRLE